MKPYSKDLRLRVLSAVDAGRPREEVAKTFSVSVPTIASALAKETSRDRGCRAQADPWQALQERGDAPTLAATQQLEANDDLTLEEHREAFEEEFGEAVSTSTAGRAIATACPMADGRSKKVEDSL